MFSMIAAFFFTCIPSANACTDLVACQFFDAIFTKFYDNRPNVLNVCISVGHLSSTILMDEQTLTFDDISVRVGDDSCNGKMK